DIAYFCCEIEGKMTCLICGQNMCSKRVQYETHREKYDQCKEKSREDKLRDFKAALVKQQCLFTNVKRDNEAVVKASYVIAERIAKNSKCFSESEFVKECLVKTAEIYSCWQKLKVSRHFLIAVDESADVSGVAQLAVFIRACDTDLIITEELLDIISLKNTTTGEDIFNEVYGLLEEYNLLLSKLVCVATDGAPSMGESPDKLCDDNWVQDLAFMVDIICHLNYLNVKLQGKRELVVSLYDSIKAFKLKLKLWKGQMKNGNLIHFPTCQDFKKSHSNSDFTSYVSQIKDLINDSENSFKGFKSWENDLSLFTAPFSFDVQKADSNIQMELIEMQCDSILKDKYNEIYLPSQCSKMRQFAARILAMFGSTYLCEQLFSLVKANETTHR
ncbi:hypothetical protein B7P43_G14030, partial [Cryptotermes secundus]